MAKHTDLLFIALMVILLAGCVNEEVKTVKMKETVIEIPFANYNHPVILGDEMFVPINRNTSDSFDVDTLIQYNVVNGDREVLYESEYDESSMQKTEVNEDWLVWVDSSSDGYYEKILAMERSSGKIRTLAETNPEFLTILSPELFHEYVAWTQLIVDGMTVEVKLHNLITNETISVAKMNDYSLYNSFVHIEDNKLLWADTKNGQGYYSLYDIESKNTEKYEAPKTYPGYATYSNGKIFSINFDDERNWTSQEFGYLDIATNEYHTFEHGEYINYFDTFANKVAVLDSENELFFYEFKNDEPIRIDVEITKDEQPYFASFDNEGHLMLNFNMTEGTNKSEIGVIYTK